MVGLINSRNKKLTFLEIESSLKKKSSFTNAAEKAVKSSNSLLAKIGIERLFELSSDPQHPIKATRAQQTLNQDQVAITLFAVDLFADLLDSSQADAIENLGLTGSEYHGLSKTLMKSTDESTFKVLIQLVQIARTVSKTHQVNSGDQ